MTWSDALQAETRRILDEREHVPMGDHVYLKHTDGRFGQIAVGDWLGGWPMTVADRRSGATEDHANIESLLAVGWAVD